MACVYEYDLQLHIWHVTYMACLGQFQNLLWVNEMVILSMYTYFWMISQNKNNIFGILTSDSIEISYKTRVSEQFLLGKPALPGRNLGITCHICLHIWHEISHHFPFKQQITHMACYIYGTTLLYAFFNNK